MRVEIKDAVTGQVAGSGAVAFDQITALVALEVLNDLDSNNSPELALLSVRNGVAQVDIKDADTGFPVAGESITFVQTAEPQAIAALDDFTCNGAPELAVLSTQGVVELRDAVTGEAVGPGTIAFTPSVERQMLRALSDISGNNMPELAVLVKQGNMTQVELKDAATGESVGVIPFGDVRTLDVLDDLSQNGAPNRGGDVQADRQRVVVQIKMQAVNPSGRTQCV